MLWIDNRNDIQSTDSMIDVSGLEKILRRKWCRGLTTVMISSKKIVCLMFQVWRGYSGESGVVD